MRSLDKGPHPVAADGSVLAVAGYDDFAPHLMQRIGRYCAYCERTVPCNLAVEHKLPKHRHGHLECDWSNLLLACGNCNSHKGKADIAADVALWPDEHDTFALIAYHESGRVSAADGLQAADARRVASLLELIGLTRTPAQITRSDHRWFDRLEVWRKALQSAADLNESDNEPLRRATIETAKSSGGYSIWRAAFAHHPDMTRRLIAAFPGTRADAPPAAVAIAASA